MDVQLYAVGADEALGELIDHAGLGTGAALDGEGAASGAGSQKLGLAAAENHGLVAVHRARRDDALLVEQAVEAVGLEELARELGVDIGGIKARLEYQRLAVYVADAGEAVDAHAAVLQL